MQLIALFLGKKIIMAKVKIKVNPRAAKELAKQIEKTISRKIGKKVKVDDKDVRKLQRRFDRLGM